MEKEKTNNDKPELNPNIAGHVTGFLFGWLTAFVPEDKESAYVWGFIFIVIVVIALLVS